jgi:hypothetical protein
MFDTRVKVHDALICCRGVTAGVIMLWFLLLAQVNGGFLRSNLAVPYR